MSQTDTHPDPAHPPAFDVSALNGAARLTEWGVIRAQGADAAAFLQSQLTQDFLLMGAGTARLAAFCSAKGRMQASFVGFQRAPDEILLLCSADVLAATLKRLSMFVMRSKLKLTDASGAFAVWGLAGSAVPAAPEWPEAAWSHLQRADGSHLIRLYPAMGLPRALWVAALDQAPAPQPPAQDLDPAHWNWLDVRSGIAHIRQATVEAYVPQMLNYESVGGVSFKKGCYPGQEVVARSQFRGTLKRRAYLAHSEAALAVGQEVFHESDPEQPCGTVAAAAAHPLSGWDAVVSLQTAAAAQGALHASGALALLPLPYPLLDDI